jgi:hypothetical protein
MTATLPRRALYATVFITSHRQQTVNTITHRQPLTAALP